MLLGDASDKVWKKHYVMTYPANEAKAVEAIEEHYFGVNKMHILKSYKPKVKKHALALFGILLALVFGIHGVYTQLFTDTNPNLHCEMQTNRLVRGVNLIPQSPYESSIDIYYSKQKGTFREITIRTTNNSENNILSGHYDEKAPFGFRVSTGEIIMPRISASSNAYLTEHLKPHIMSDTTIQFANVIIDSIDYFEVNFLVHYDKSNQLTIETVGKIAGIATIPIIDAYEWSDVPITLPDAYNASCSRLVHGRSRCERSIYSNHRNH